MNQLSDSLYTAHQVVTALREQNRKVVFAESCTCGLLAATLGRVPGASQVLCGSAVTYRNATKQHWLQVDSHILQNPDIGPVSEQVARQMAWGVLQKTPEADLAISVTGHLGPDAPAEQDGLVFSGSALRGHPLEQIEVFTYRLPAQYPSRPASCLLRHLRQDDLVERILNDLLLTLRQSPEPPARSSGPLHPDA
jgi:nicotinamide-nucleotide amidase